MSKCGARPTKGNGKCFSGKPIPLHQTERERRKEVSGDQRREWPANLRFADAEAVEPRLFTRIVPRDHVWFSQTGCSAASCALPID